MALEGGEAGFKPTIVREAPKDKGTGGGKSRKDLFTTMMPGQEGMPAGGVTPPGDVVARANIVDFTADLNRATALVERHGIKGSAGQQLQELARRVTSGEIDWNQALED